MEHLALTWTRPDGEEAVKLCFTYATPEEVSAIVANLLDVLEGARLNAQAQRPAVKDTVRGMEGQ